MYKTVTFIFCYSAFELCFRSFCLETFPQDYNFALLEDNDLNSTELPTSRSTSQLETTTNTSADIETVEDANNIGQCKKRTRTHLFQCMVKYMNKVDRWEFFEDADRLLVQLDNEKPPCKDFWTKFIGCAQDKTDCWPFIARKIAHAQNKSLSNKMPEEDTPGEKQAHDKSYTDFLNKIIVTWAKCNGLEAGNSLEECFEKPGLPEAKPCKVMYNRLKNDTRTKDMCHDKFFACRNWQLSQHCPDLMKNWRARLTLCQIQAFRAGTKCTTIEKCKKSEFNNKANRSYFAQIINIFVTLFNVALFALEIVHV
ncbi:hypothetical protein Ddc_09909 [Ditylenchus destructor]|nr:hypothetical protein Ddc_09909 [Ditylenchus destructor]